MGEENVERWRADDPLAKDLLLQHDYERCLADLSYRRAHAAWFEQATQERRRRQAEEEAAKRHAEARELFANRHDRAAVEYEAREGARREGEEKRLEEVRERMKRAATL
jgi:hypothetical protein